MNIKFTEPNVRFSVYSLDKKNEAELTENTLKTAVFNNPSFVIKTSFNQLANEKNGVIQSIKNGTQVVDNSFFQGKRYTNLFKKSVLWDFGDGTMIEGTTAEHAYTTAGKYTITCTFFDVDKMPYKNSYSVDVIVKETIPTILRFAETPEMVETKISKISKVAKIEALRSFSVETALDVLPKRVLPKNIKLANFFELPKDSSATLDNLYYSFYGNKEKSPLFSFEPVSKYTPDYQTIYGQYLYDEATQKNVLSLMAVMEEVNPADEKCHIRLISPNADNPQKEQRAYEEVEIPIRQAFTQEEIPKDYTIIGYRAFVDVFYKSDLKSTGDKLFFSYDLEGQKPFNEIDNTANYINMTPLGVSVKVSENDAEPEYALSLNGFLHDINAETGMDVFLENSIVQELIENVYYLPYIKYTPDDFGLGEDTFFSCTPFYYLPKDVEVNATYTPAPTNVSPQPVPNTKEGIKWYNRHLVLCKEVLNFTVGSCILRGKESEAGYARALENVIVPHEKYHEEDEVRLVNALTPHAVFNKSENVRESLRALFRNDEWLNKTMTKILEFFDDTVNVDKCHVEYLVSILNSMADNTSEYSENIFNAVNEIRNFARIASMNHSLLVGHENIETLDIAFNGEIKGKNVGEEILPTDVVFADKNGLLAGFLRKEKFYKITPHVPIIVYDKYTKMSRTTNFHNIPSSIHYEGNEKFFDEETSTSNTTAFTIQDYSPLWGWNLLLPDRYYMQTLQRDIVEGYYQFFLLNPKLSMNRYGNFLDENTMDESIIDVEKWEGDWESMYKICQKLLLLRGELIDTGKP